MPYDVRFIVLSQEEGFAATLRNLFVKMDGVKIVAQVEEPALLAQAVGQLSADALLVNLDPSPKAILPIIGDIIKAHPLQGGHAANLAVFAVSESTDGPLILEAMRMGIREFLPKPIDPQALTEAVDRFTASAVRTTPVGTFITVVGTSGGVGATLIATNLGVELAALAEGQVTVVDLDYRFGQVATLLDVNPKYTLADLCSSPEQLDPQMIERALMSHSSGVRVLSRPTLLSEAEGITAAASIGVFSNLVGLNEYVVADGPTRFDVAGKSLLTLSDVTLVVVQPLVPCVRNARRLLETLREHGLNMEQVKLICNRVGPLSGHLSVDDITETLGLESFASLPDDWATASGAINLGEPLKVNSPKSKLRIAIEEIAQHLHTSGRRTDDKGDTAPLQGDGSPTRGHGPAGKASRKGIHDLIGRIFASG